ncbi:uncharacterized protein LOC125249626 [Megalobrama amblycephala]|uniref:uncharacterized protein LOC125249626 n=1 Tax=Megalobrama amblycephala TaxID=75352 RepID=UPI0020141A19|nr:uncharacterized protein LOC125249626 [Megalobrama amblycephala]
MPQRMKMNNSLPPESLSVASVTSQKWMPQRMKMNNSLPQNNTLPPESLSVASVTSQKWMPQRMKMINSLPPESLSVASVTSQKRMPQRMKMNNTLPPESLSVRKRHVSEMDASENEDELLSTSKQHSTSRKSVHHSPAHKQHIIEMFSGKKAPRRPWSSEEQDAVKRTLRKFFSLRKVPGKVACQSCLDANPVLKSRSWVDIKNFVHNTLQTMKRKLASCRNAV